MLMLMLWTIRSYFLIRFFHCIILHFRTWRGFRSCFAYYFGTGEVQVDAYIYIYNTSILVIVLFRVSYSAMSDSAYVLCAKIWTRTDGALYHMHPISPLSIAQYDSICDPNSRLREGYFRLHEKGTDTSRSSHLHLHCIFGNLISVGRVRILCYLLPFNALLPSCLIPRYAHQKEVESKEGKNSFLVAS